MKRFFAISGFCLLSAASPLCAQDAATAAAIASRQEAAENYNTLKGHVDDLIAAQETQAKEILALRKEIAELRLQISQPSSNYASAEALKRLSDVVAELDKTRIADNEKIIAAIKAAAEPPSHGNPPKPPPPDHGAPVANGDQTGFYYTIKKDDSIGAIAQGYRDQGVKVTSKQIEDANPTVNPAKLVVGKKLFIPAKEPSAKP